MTVRSKTGPDRASLPATIDFVLDPQGNRVVHASPAIKILTGFDAQDFIDAKLHFADLIHPDDRDLGTELFASTTHEISKTINFRLRQANRQIICLQGHYQKKMVAAAEVLLQLQLYDVRTLPSTLIDQTTVKHFITLIENTDDYIFFKDRHHVFIGASSSLASLSAYSRQGNDLSGQTDYDVFPETYADNYYHQDEQIFSGKVDVIHEVQPILDRHKNIGWVDNRKYPIKDQSGAIIGLVGIARDITASKRMTDQLQQSEQRFRDLFENSPDPCWIIENRHFSQCNKAAMLSLGYSDKVSILSHPSELSPEFQPDGQHSFTKANNMMTIALQKGIHRFEWIHKRCDGVCFPVEVTLARIQMAGNNVLYCIWRDISERKQALQRHHANERLLTTIFEQAAVGVALIDTVSGRFERINQRYCDIVGYSKAEMLAGKTFQHITYPDDLRADLDNMAKLVAGAIRDFNMEKRYI